MSNTTRSTNTDTIITVRGDTATFESRTETWTEDELCPGDVLFDVSPIGHTGHLQFNVFDGDVVRVDEVPLFDGSGGTFRQVVSDVGVLDVPRNGRLTITYRGTREAWRAATGWGCVVSAPIPAADPVDTAFDRAADALDDIAADLTPAEAYDLFQRLAAHAASMAAATPGGES
jgi:hypothetical protein